MSKKEMEFGDDFQKTVGADARFPNQNQTYRCFSSFLDYHRCTQLFDEGHEPCEYFKKVFTVICPNMWIEKWTQQLEDGTFPGFLPNDRKKEQ